MRGSLDRPMAQKYERLEREVCRKAECESGGKPNMQNDDWSNSGTSGVLVAHGICLMDFAKNSDNAGRVAEMHGQEKNISGSSS